MALPNWSWQPLTSPPLLMETKLPAIPDFIFLLFQQDSPPLSKLPQPTTQHRDPVLELSLNHQEIRTYKEINN